MKMKSKKDGGSSPGVSSGLSHAERFKADQSTGPEIGTKTQRPVSSDYGGKHVEK